MSARKFTGAWWFVFEDKAKREARDLEFMRAMANIYGTPEWAAVQAQPLQVASFTQSLMEALFGPSFPGQL